MDPPANPEPACDDDAPRERSIGTLLARTAQPFVVIDLDGRIVGANRAFEALLGYPAEALGRLTVHDLTPPRWRAGNLEILAEVRRTGKSARYEKEYIRADGRVIPVEITADLDEGEGGGPRGFFGFVTDIAERKAAERALMDSEARFRQLFDGAPVGFHEIDRDGTIVDINRTECEMLGCTRAEAVGRPIFDFVAEEFRETARAAVAAKFRGEKPLVPFERPLRTADGRRIVAAIQERFHRDERGEIVGIRSAVRDVTERVRAEAALVESESRYRRLTESSLDPVVVVDGSGAIRLFNPAATRTFGYSADEAVGLPVSAIIPDGIEPARDVGRTLERVGLHRDGEAFPIEISLAALDPAGSPDGGWVGSIRDTGERQRMRDLLAQSEKLASIGLLSAGVAHEINNPLAYVSNNLAVLRRDVDGIFALIAAYESARNALAAADPECLARVDAAAEELDWAYARDNTPRMLDRTREGVARVAAIVGNLRGLARTTAPVKEPAAAADLVEGAVEMIRGRLKLAQIRLDLDHAPGPKVACVPTQVVQVILNLLVNAAQAIEARRPPEGGRITVTTRYGAGSLVIAVGDNGAGIAAEHLPRLFDPFFTTKAVGEGTGLGLAVSHGIVDGHGGRIAVESTPGRGTVFFVHLPIAPR